MKPRLIEKAAPLKKSVILYAGEDTWQSQKHLLEDTAFMCLARTFGKPE
ncbi:MAG: hypothetical protein AAFW75_24725 [Cyanobacteria bacterium J06636_16]